MSGRQGRGRRHGTGMARTAFEVRAFRRLWAAGLISDCGDWLLLVALPLVVLRLTGSALGTAAAYLLELVPMVVLAPVLARVVARFGGRYLMVGVNVLQAVCLVPLFAVHTARDLPLTYGVIATQATLTGLFEPAKNALLPTLVGPARLVSANALVGLNLNLARLIGGPLGGVMLAIGHLSLIVAIDIASYLGSALLVLLTRIPRPERNGAEPSSGFLTALRAPSLRGVLTVTLVAGIAQGLFLVLFVLFVIRQLHGSDADVGLLRGVQAIGSIAAGLSLGILSRKLNPRTLVTLGAAAFGALSLIIWNLPQLSTARTVYVALFILIGAPGIVLVTGTVTTLQHATQEAGRGAAFTALGAVNAVGQGVGLLAGGLVDTGVSLGLLLEIQGGLYVISAVTALCLVPARPTTVPLPKVSVEHAS